MSGLREALEEPAYLAFARANTKANQSSGPGVVKALIERIERDAKALATILAAHPDDSVTEWGVVYYGSYSVRVDWGYASDPTPLIDAEGEFDLGAGSWVRPTKVVSRISSPIKTVWETT